MFATLYTVAVTFVSAGAWGVAGQDPSLFSDGSADWLVDTRLKSAGTLVTGLILLVVTAYIVLGFSALNARWARFMLGSRARARPPSRPAGTPLSREGGPLLPPAMAAIAPFPQLTPREYEVPGLIAAGQSNAEIAEALFVSEGTVKTHVKRVLGKIEVRDRTQAAVLALTNGREAPET